MMNPFKVSFFDKSEDKTALVPIIRIVFALASSTPSVVALNPAKRTQPPRSAAYKAEFQKDKYTAFDLWCASASQYTFKPIEDDGVFKQLLLQSRVFPEVYTSKGSKSIEEATRSMNPGTDSRDTAHWDRFIQLEGSTESNPDSDSESDSE